MFRGCPLKIKGYQSNFKPYLVKRISIKIYYKLLYGINKRSNSKELRHLPSVKAASAMTSWNILGYRCSFSLPRMLVTSLAPSSMFSSSSSWRAWKFTANGWMVCQQRRKITRSNLLIFFPGKFFFAMSFNFEAIIPKYQITIVIFIARNQIRIYIDRCGSLLTRLTWTVL